jgi:hypothetical protein
MRRGKGGGKGRLNRCTNNSCIYSRTYAAACCATHHVYREEGTFGVSAGSPPMALELIFTCPEIQ